MKKKFVIVLLIILSLLITIDMTNLFCTPITVGGIMSVDGPDWTCNCPKISHDCWCRFEI